MFVSFCTFLIVNAYLSSALPLDAEYSSLDRRQSVYNIPGDPAYSVPEAALKAAIDCPTGSSNSDIVLLVPGTGERASDFFAKNLGELFPANGFPVCYLDTPDMSIGDMQITSEYVAYAINTLASATSSKIRVLSHSQGGSDVQWALTFWPSTRGNVASFVALGPAWQGTQIGSLVTAIRQFLTGKGVASVFQQGAGSKFLTAMAAHGGHTSLVPTTSLITVTDEIVQPSDSGVLPGSRAVNIKLQDICPGRIQGHFGLVVDSISQFFALQAFKAGSTANIDDVSSAELDELCAAFLPRFTSVNAVVEFTKDMMLSVIKTVITGQGSNQVTQEPPLKTYAL